jgi:hypothetical protein
MNDPTMTEIQKLEGQVGAVDVKVTSVLNILRGNEINRADTGMIGIQDDHERRLTKVERFIDRAKWFLIGLSLPAGWGMIDIIQKLITK